MEKDILAGREHGIVIQQLEVPIWHLKFRLWWAVATCYGGRRYLLYAFTELGVAMLSSVLNSDRAVQMNIVIMRAFVKLREVLATNKALAQRIEQMAATQKDHAALFDIVIKDIQALDQKTKSSAKKSAA
ncbi:MAG: hypothetical protein ACLQU1_40780 [Bryobacteraceae bacterium]